MISCQNNLGLNYNDPSSKKGKVLVCLIGNHRRRAPESADQHPKVWTKKLNSNILVWVPTYLSELCHMVLNLVGYVLLSLSWGHVQQLMGCSFMLVMY